MSNEKVAYLFKSIAKILEFKKENPFRVRAYEKAARIIETMQEDLESVMHQKRLTEIAGIGKDLASKINEFYDTGKISFHDELIKTLPKELDTMLDIPGITPKILNSVCEKFFIDTIKELKELCLSERILEVSGVKERTKNKILQGIKLLRESSKKVPFYFALVTANHLMLEFKDIKEIERIKIVGSLRRRVETVDIIELLIAAKNKNKLIDELVNSEGVEKLLQREKNFIKVEVKDSLIPAVFYFTNKNDFIRDLLFYTGTEKFYNRFKSFIKEKKVKIDAYEEKKIFSLVDMAYIPAQLRDDDDIIAKALKTDKLDLVESHNLKGDLHVHSYYSDGMLSIEQIAFAADKMGYSYIAICDHSQYLKVANGLDERAVNRKLDEIKRVNADYPHLKILCGTEVEILNDGSLDYPDRVLKKFDLVVAALHLGLRQQKQQLTKRLVSACKNKYVNVLAHPTSKLWGQRLAYDVDLEEVFETAVKNNVALEINSHPQRMDLNDVNCKLAKSKGAIFAINSDTHSFDSLRMLSIGVDIAKRAGLNKNDVVNCKTKTDLLKWIKSKR